MSKVSREIYRKVLTPSEKERHWVRVPPKVLSPNMVVKIICKSKIFDIEIDDQHRLRLGSKIFNELDLDASGSVAILIHVEEGLYEIKRGSSKNDNIKSD